MFLPPGKFCPSKSNDTCQTRVRALRELTNGDCRPDDQIANIAKQAYEDMVAGFGADSKGVMGMKQPNVVTVIVTGKTAYISSSMTGKSLFPQNASPSGTKPPL